MEYRLALKKKVKAKSHSILIQKSKDSSAFDEQKVKNIAIEYQLQSIFPTLAIAILPKLKFYAPPSLLETVYYGIVYPHLSYAITTWGNAASTRLNKVQVMQNHPVRIITKKCNQRTRMSPQRKTNSLPELFQDYFYSTTDIHKFATRQAGRHDLFLPRSSSNIANNSIEVCGVKVLFRTNIKIN